VSTQDQNDTFKWPRP